MCITRESERVVNALLRGVRVVAAHVVRVGEQVEMFVAGETRVHQRLLRAVPEPARARHGAGVGGERPDQDLHERGLPGPVLTDQPDDLTATQRQGGAAQHRLLPPPRPHSAPK
jgi:hypothetical protein